MKAIILKKNIFDEGSEIVTFYAREEGKVRAVAKAVKSAKSKLAHGLESLFYTDIEVLPHHKLPTIIGVKPINTFINMRDDLQKVYLAFFAAELILKSTADEQPNQELFDSFLELLEHLNNSSSSTAHLCADAFALRLLGHTGYALTFDTCSICNKQLGEQLPDQPIYFSNRKGGFVCESCSQKIADANRIGLDVYHFLKTAEHKSYAEIDKASIPTKPLHTFVDSFATHILERNLNASKYLGTLK